MSGTRPRFVCVGGAKCGTTALYDYLRQHPQVYLPDQKELHHFSAPLLDSRPHGPGMARALGDVVRDPATYARHFAMAGAGQVAGDISPSYLNDPDAPARIMAALGPVRIIVMLRDPVERVMSQYMHLRRAGREPLDLAAALDAEPQRTAAQWGDMWRYRAAARGAEGLGRYLALFGPQRVSVVLNHELRLRPDAVLRALCADIGVDPDWRFRPVTGANRSGQPHSAALGRMLDASAVSALAKRILPRRLGARIKDRLQALNTGAQLDMPAPLAAALAMEFASDVAAIEHLIGRATGWRAG